jgi:hypothetical protein
MGALEQINAYTSRLPEQAQREVLHFIEFLASKYPPTPEQNMPLRQANLHQGQGIIIADDFDAPLGDDFWLGKS